MSPRLPRARSSLPVLLALLLAACQTPAPGTGPGSAREAVQERPQPAQVDPYRYGVFAYLAAQLARQTGQLSEAAGWFARTAEVTGRAGLYAEAVNTALQDQNGAAAEGYAERWRQAEPGRPEPLLALARTRAQQEDAEGAAQAMGRLVTAHPEPEGDLPSAGERLAEVGGVSVAVQALRRTAQAHPDSAAAHLIYGHLLARLGQGEAAVGELRQALVLRPGWETAVVELAQAMDAEEGVAVLREFLADHPDADRARLRFAQALLATDRPAAAAREYAALAEARPESAEVHMGLGLAHFHQQHWARATEAFRRVRQLDPGNNAALFHLGRVAEEQGRPAEASGYYSRIDNGRYLQQARLREAVTAVKSGDLQRALQLIRQMRSQQPGEPEYYRLEARILAELGQLRAAEQVAAKGLRLDPGHVELLYTRAIVREQRGDYAGMEADIRQVLEERPEDARAYNFLGYSLADRGVRLDEALTLIRQALEREPEAGYIIDSLGWVYYRMGELAKAERHLRRAAELAPEDTEIFAHLGEVLEAQGRTEAARRIWRKALEQAEPGSRLARELERRLDGEDQR